MMNQEDKRFIIQAITQSEKRLNAKIDGLETRVDGLDAKIDELRIELKDEIHQQGILLEHLNDKIDIVAENTVGVNSRIAVLEERVGIQ
ncbi:hypothetical protein HZA43_04940 [Candidatus Peregrinibacteria bacterium]|nr:hypothetical protein [Candidatus Peregrinibacteria bacterium]